MFLSISHLPKLTSHSYQDTSIYYVHRTRRTQTSVFRVNSVSRIWPRINLIPGSMKVTGTSEFIVVAPESLMNKVHLTLLRWNDSQHEAQSKLFVHECYSSRHFSLMWTYCRHIRTCSQTSRHPWAWILLRYTLLTEEEDTFTFDLNHLCLLIRNLPSYAVKGYISFGCVQDNLSFTGACPSARASSLWCCNQGRGRLCPQHPRHHWPGDHWQGHLQEFTGMNFPKALWTKFECFAPPCHPLYPW